MTLEEIEKRNILDLMSRYRSLHEEIAKIEKSINDFNNSLKDLYKTKDIIVGRLEENRETEATLIKMLVEKYGEGRLNTNDMTWVPNETKE